MNAPGRKPAALINSSIYWLMGIAVVCLLAILGLKVFFDDLQDELREKSDNERARLFVGDDIVRNIQGIDKDLYRMMASASEADVARVRHTIDRHIERTERDLDVLKQGGTVERILLLNLEGHEETTQSATYRPDGLAQEYVMESIEIAPLLDKMGEMADTLEFLVLRRIDCLARQDPACLERVQPEFDIFLKQLPSFVQRTSENANRLFFDSSERLAALEVQLSVQRAKLKQVEMGLIALVMALAGLVAMAFVRRINQANRRLERAVDQMRAAKDEAERASRAKSEFVSRMSHELRTPLNAIIGFADLLEAEPLSPSHKSYVGLINSSGRHLMELINAVLDHAKIEAGSLTLEEIAFDFPATIEAVKDIIAERATSKGLEFVASIAPDLPKFVRGDPTRLRQVLINLLVNAVKFTEQGSVELRVAPEDGRIFFSVRDSGIGMDEESLARLFQAFTQGDDSITRRYGGTGLGLIISKELIQAMGGAIEVESAPGVGTCFWFWLPLQAAPAPEQSAGGSAQTGMPAIASRVAGRVLLVDDNRVNQQLAAAMLDRLGLPHDMADNGAEALLRLNGTRYALVLMDMEMPEMDGVAATRHIREREDREGTPRLPIVAMTANALREDKERCLAAGMDGYIAKPISRKALQDELFRLFAGTSPPLPAGVAAVEPAKEAAVAGPNESVDKPVFDHAAALERIGDAEVLQNVAAMFVASAPTDIRALEAALATGDWLALRRVAHTLKGLFATFAASDGEQAARELELSAGFADDAHGDTCAELTARVRDHVNALCEALTRHTGGKGRPD
jgi:signal transduction histidine kinase/DNA-binding NarL/FixJ family response regulator/HPt (histidine-containing phosphotransfer) domain-containing protein